MWNCQKCGETVEDNFDACWKCSTPRTGAEPAAAANKTAGGNQKNWRLTYKYFRGTLATWDQLFSEAAQFATEKGPEYVVDISHSSDKGNGVVTVWYWEPAEAIQNA